jgi:hypothetical protein
MKEEPKGDWIRTIVELPTEDTVVWTKIDNNNDPHNIVKLKRHRNIWFVPDGSMYVYYQPTHWMSFENKLPLEEKVRRLWELRAKLAELSEELGKVIGDL